jgi:uncharacterized protein (TIGR01777 family)
MKIAITGASGFIGRRLMKDLRDHSLTVLSRHAGTNLPPGVSMLPWNAAAGPPDAAALSGVDAVVHLAGEPIAQRWTPAVKQRIRDSRVAGTRNLVQALAQLPAPPKVLVSSSAIGYYGSRGDEVLTERSAPGSGFLPDICVAWEREADAAAELGIRVVKIRTGVVLAAHGGALQKMLPPFRLGLGGPIGSGKQWMSWIHLDDLVGLVRHAIEGQVSGAVNGVAPNPVTNADFTRVLGRVLHRPTVFPVPAFALRLLFGEMSEVLLGSQRVVPEAAQGSGYRFEYAELEAALRNAGV